MAETFGLTEKTVESRLTRARSAFRAEDLAIREQAESVLIERIDDPS